MNEQWRPVEGWPYEVSDHGQVRRVTPAQATRPGVILRGARSGGYRTVSLCCRGRTKTHSVHRLVATAFLGPCPPGKQANHKNGIKADNRVENLEWVTPGDNTRHAAAAGHFPHGMRHGNASLAAEAVEEIRALYGTGVFTQRRLAERFGVHHTHIGRIVRRVARCYA